MTHNNMFTAARFLPKTLDILKIGCGFYDWFLQLCLLYIAADQWWAKSIVQFDSIAIWVSHPRFDLNVDSIQLVCGSILIRSKSCCSDLIHTIWSKICEILQNTWIPHIIWHRKTAYLSRNFVVKNYYNQTTIPQLIANNMSGCFFSETLCSTFRAFIIRYSPVAALITDLYPKGKAKQKQKQKQKKKEGHRL